MPRAFRPQGEEAAIEAQVFAVLGAGALISYVGTRAYKRMPI
jgi:hypothetical protein